MAVKECPGLLLVVSVVVSDVLFVFEEVPGIFCVCFGSSGDFLRSFWWCLRSLSAYFHVF